MRMMQSPTGKHDCRNTPGRFFVFSGLLVHGVQRDRDSAADEKRFAAWLFVAVFASRALTSSSAYFGDANRHLVAIQNHSYVIQPPGYWLSNRTAGLFPDPEIAISVMNWCFSAAGAVAFYLAARRLARESVAGISSVAYAATFFTRLSGNVHSTYASQLFFPVAVFLCFLHYGHGLASLAVVSLICVSWPIPQELGPLKQIIPIERNFSSQIASIADGVLVVGFSPYALSNVVRLAVPFVLALFPLLSLIFGDRKQTFLWIWSLPGMAFYLLIFFSEGPYLGYMLAALILLAVTNSTTPDQKKAWLLAACAAVNIAFYFAWRPMKFSNHTLQVAEYVIDADADKHTYDGVQHHYAPTLSQFLQVRGYGEAVPRSGRQQ
jgi:hypothetical protein